MGVIRSMTAPDGQHRCFPPRPHRRLVAPQRRYFAALAVAAPGRVLFLDTTARDNPTGAVLAAVAALPPGRPDAAPLLRRITSWVGTYAPDAPTA